MKGVEDEGKILEGDERLLVLDSDEADEGADSGGERNVPNGTVEGGLREGRYEGGEGLVAEGCGR